MRRLCFGGSFNPIHHGHLICARAAAEAKGFDKVVLIPAAHPPHKPENAEIAPAEHRLAMCRLATQGCDFFEVADLEFRRQGPSFTLDTTRELRKSGWGEVHWLIGADMLMNLPQWHEAATLLTEAEFIVMARPGWQLNWNDLPPPYRKLQASIVTTPSVDISATDIRQRIAAAKSIRYLTPEPVVDYIRANRLYS